MPYDLVYIKPSDLDPIALCDNLLLTLDTEFWSEREL